MSRTSTPTRVALPVAGVVVLVVMAGAAAAALNLGPNASSERRPNHPTSYTDDRSSVPQSATADDAVGTTLAGLDTGLFRDVRVGAAPSPADWQGRWLYATMNATSDGGSYIREVWEADLAQGAIADRLSDGVENLANVIVGSSINVVTPDGKSVSVTGGAGDIASGQRFAAAEESDSVIERQVEDVVEARGLKLSDVRVLRPLGPAVAAVVVVSSPSQLKSDFEALRQAIVGSPLRYEGLYLEIDLPDGSPLVRAATSYRSGAGRLWVAPGYDDLVGAVHGGTPQ